MEIRTELWNGYPIRFVEKEPGDWWAVAKDVAEALGYKLTTNMTRLLDNGDKGVHKVNTLGGEQEQTVISEFGIYDAVFSSHKAEAKNFKRWVFDVIKALRQGAGFEGFQIFRMLDKEHQKEAMRNLSDSLSNPVQVDFIKANTIANKAVSTKYGHPKMLRKEQMTPEMLVNRQPILDDVVTLMSANKGFGLGLSVSRLVYSKHCGQFENQHAVGQ